MEFHRGYAYRSDRVLDCPFVRLIHKVPYVYRSVWLSDKNNSGSWWTPASASVIWSFGNHAGKYRRLNSYFPNAKIEIVDCQNYVLIRRHKIKRNYRPEVPLLIPVLNNSIVFATRFVCTSGSPVTDEQLALVRWACEDCSLLVFFEIDERTSHSSSTFRSEQMKAIASLPLIITQVSDRFFVGIDKFFLP